MTGRAVDARGLHLTLVFLGEQDKAVVAPLCDALAATEWPTGTFSVDTLGHFPKAAVTWAGLSDVPEALAATALKVRELVGHCGIAHDDHSSFVPHVTLFRKTRGEVTPSSHAAIAWPLSTPRLVRSVSSAQGVRYIPW